MNEATDILRRRSTDYELLARQQNERAEQGNSYLALHYSTMAVALREVALALDGEDVGRRQAA